MASLRRTKNHANDPQTPIFLYAILKQLDLKPIDWQAVADQIGITNGHAARMRYSRMKSQLEGIAPPAKTLKGKKATEPSKVMAKDRSTKAKRQLQTEEEERLYETRIIGLPTYSVYSSGETLDRSKRSKREHGGMSSVDGGLIYLDPTGQIAAVKQEMQNTIDTASRNTRRDISIKSERADHIPWAPVKQEIVQDVMNSHSAEFTAIKEVEFNTTPVTGRHSVSPSGFVKQEPVPKAASIRSPLAVAGRVHLKTEVGTKGACSTQDFQNDNISLSWPMISPNLSTDVFESYSQQPSPAAASLGSRHYPSLNSSIGFYNNVNPTPFEALAAFTPMVHGRTSITNSSNVSIPSSYLGYNFTLDPNATSYLEMLNKPLYASQLTDSTPAPAAIPNAKTWTDSQLTGNADSDEIMTQFSSQDSTTRTQKIYTESESASLATQQTTTVREDEGEDYAFERQNDGVELMLSATEQNALENKAHLDVSQYFSIPPEIIELED